MQKTLFLLGATGFIGKAVTGAAIRDGWRVKALVRSHEARAWALAAGAVPVSGSGEAAASWAAEAEGADVLLDLIQPRLPTRLNGAAIRTAANYRLKATAGILDALAAMPPERRPLLLSVSGVDDLLPDENGRVSHRSALRGQPVGFAHIGLPVRRLIEDSGLPATFVYLGTVYGPGKSFADQILPGLARRRTPIVGSGTNRMALIHLADAAQALVLLAGLPRASLMGRSFVACDGNAVTQGELLRETAALMGASMPFRFPLWLATLVRGRPLIETICRDTVCDPSALLALGFRFRFPSHREGMRDTLAALGYPLAESAPTSFPETEHGA